MSIDQSKKVIIEFAKTLEMFDLSQLDARLFVYLYLADEPLTLDEMSAALGKSKTSMSTSARNLSDANLISRVWKKGVRKDLYEANSNLFRLFMNSHINQWIAVTKHQKEIIKDIEESLKQMDIPNDKGTFHQKVQQIIHFHAELEDFFQEIATDL
ncbi:MAG TPA: transcriptional regulator [Candidatus Avamphibacillus sp.]|nr:transcriptional regulator [Candidatus Avamphibacillus sp.]